MSILLSRVAFGGASLRKRNGRKSQAIQAISVFFGMFEGAGVRGSPSHRSYEPTDDFSIFRACGQEGLSRRRSDSFARRFEQNAFPE
jgi:hypothetical protein